MSSDPLLKAAITHWGPRFVANGVVLTAQGIHGDRIVHVENSQHHPITSRTHPKLLGLRGRLNAAGQVEVDGREWTHPEVRAKIEGIVGSGARLMGESGLYRFDMRRQERQCRAVK